MTDNKAIVDVRKSYMNDVLSADEVEKIIKCFLNKFDQQYSTLGPLSVSFMGPLDEALNNSLFEPTLPRPLVLYLHNSQSIAVNIFYQYVLCDEINTNHLAEEFLIWTWDRTEAINHSILLGMLFKYTTKEVATTVNSFSVDAYPLLVFLSVHQDEIDVVSVIQGNMSTGETRAQILESRKKFNRRTELPHSKFISKELVSNENEAISTHLLKPLVDRSPTIETITKEFKELSTEIIRIDQVENATWLPKYLEQKQIIDTQINHNQNEQFLYHGCSRVAAEQIIQRGFDQKLIGKHGTSYGRGFYFSSSLYTSDLYATRNLSSNGEKTMLVCRVLVGRSCLGDGTMIKCPTDYESTTDGFQTYVVYSNEQILPEYVVTYKDQDNIGKYEFLNYTTKTSTKQSCNIS